MASWKPIKDGKWWRIVLKDWKGKIIQEDSSLFESYESAKIMAQQYNAGL